MALRLTVLVLLAIGAACGGTKANPLVGIWKLDVAASKEGLAPKVAERLSKMKFELTFTETEIKYMMDVMGNTNSDTATYAIAKRDGNRFTVETTDRNGRKDSQTLTVDGDVLKMAKTGMSLILRRQ
ncbi:MAG: hypothetical protein OER88_08515 [Planctomycetota bacterium]|nr:hypothetical protein [Planctomycetota bacterium]